MNSSCFICICPLFYSKSSQTSYIPMSRAEFSTMELKAGLTWFPDPRRRRRRGKAEQIVSQIWKRTEFVLSVLWQVAGPQTTIAQWCTQRAWTQAIKALGLWKGSLSTCGKVVVGLPDFKGPKQNIIHITTMGLRVRIYPQSSSTICAFSIYISKPRVSPKWLKSNFLSSCLDET